MPFKIHSKFTLYRERNSKNIEDSYQDKSLSERMFCQLIGIIMTLVTKRPRLNRDANRCDNKCSRITAS